MKILLDYKIGPYARFRKLKILISEDILSDEICLTEIKQGERKEAEIPENIKSLQNPKGGFKSHFFILGNVVT